MIECTIMESRDVTFFENEFPMKNTPSTSSHDSISFDDIYEPINNANFETHVETPEKDYIQSLERVRDEGL